jgi:hypothetical protein
MRGRLSDEGAGAPPSSYNPAPAAAMQPLTRIDGATQNGSEQIFVPSASGAWLPTTHVAGDDPNQPNAPRTTLSKDASCWSSASAFGASNVGAVRAFFDFVITHALQFITPSLLEVSP